MWYLIWTVFPCFETFRTCNILFSSSKACKMSFLIFFFKSLHYFNKKKLLVQWKDVYKRNIWKIFKYQALFETFRTYFLHQKRVRRLLIKNFKSLYFPVIHQKRVRRLFFSFFFKKLALFLKKTRFWCGWKTSIKKQFSNIRPYLRLFGLLFSSSKACKMSF